MLHSVIFMGMNLSCRIRCVNSCPPSTFLRPLLILLRT